MQILVRAPAAPTLSVIRLDSTSPTFFSNIKANSNLVGMQHFFLYKYLSNRADVGILSIMVYFV